MDGPDNSGKRMRKLVDLGIGSGDQLALHRLFPIFLWEYFGYVELNYKCKSECKVRIEIKIET